jgi:GNAT superfamily N-acetyltransferase
MYPKTSLHTSKNYTYIIAEDGSSSNTIFFNLRDSKSQLDVVELEQIFGKYQQFGISPRFTILSDSDDIKSVLSRLNSSQAYSVVKCYDAVSMSLNVNSNSEELKSERAQNFEIAQVTSSNLPDYISVMADVWGLPQEELKNFSNQVLWGIENYPKEYIPFVGYVGGKPVATSGLIMQQAGPLLVSSCVRPAFRGKGFYKELIQHRAQIAKNAGFDRVFVHAKVLTSAPICEHVGFKKDFFIQVFELKKIA